GKSRAKLLDEPSHVRAEILSFSRREQDRLRFVRGAEIVHVADVVRNGLAGGAFIEQRPNSRVLSRARTAHREDVVAVVAHAKAEPERVERAILAESRGERLELGRRAKWQSLRLAPSAEILGCERSDHRNLISSLRSSSAALPASSEREGC